MKCFRVRDCIAEGNRQQIEKKIGKPGHLKKSIKTGRLVVIPRQLTVVTLSFQELPDKDNSIAIHIESG